MLNPPQRGGYDISEPGSHSCYQPTAPCGTVTPSSPTFTLDGGTTFNIFLQQNLNHYNQGFPGFVDVSYAVGSNQTSDKQFTRLAVIPDYWPHFQGTQTNFSIPFTVPNIDCQWCTLQIRYNPNKPNEPIFHQCADVKIVKTTPRQFTGTLVGVSKTAPTSELDGHSSLVNIDPNTGILERREPAIAQRDIIEPSKLTEAIGMGMITGHNGTMVTIGGEFHQSYPFVFLKFQDVLNDGTSSGQTTPSPSSITQWVSVITSHSSDTPTPFLLIGQSRDPFTYTAYWVSHKFQLSDPIGTTESDSTYVNFLWAEFNPCAGSAGQLYLLSGDEDSVTALGVKLFTFDIGSGNVTSVNVDNSQFTISSVHAFPAGDCKNLYTVSPGLVDTAQTERVWNLITIDVATGQIAYSMPVSEMGLYNQFYGGGVAGQAIDSEGNLFHVFQRDYDKSFDLKLINVKTGQTTLSTALNLGLNSVISVNSFAFIPHAE